MHGSVISVTSVIASWSGHDATQPQSVIQSPSSVIGCPPSDAGAVARDAGDGASVIASASTDQEGGNPLMTVMTLMTLRCGGFPEREVEYR